MNKHRSAEAHAFDRQADHACWQARRVDFLNKTNNRGRGSTQGPEDIVSVLGVQFRLSKHTLQTARKLIAFYALLIALGVRPSVVVAAPPAALGIEAKGMDAWTALKYAGTLDVRDSQNRPVSAERIQREISGAQRLASHEADGASRLPYADKILRILDDLIEFGAALAPIRNCLVRFMVGFLPSRSPRIAREARRTIGVLAREQAPLNHSRFVVIHAVNPASLPLRC